MTSRDLIRIANCSGFFGDRFSAPRGQMAGPIDVLTGDYLAELTMAILAKAHRRDSSLGYATTFLRQMEDLLGPALERQVKIVANAGGLNPRSLAEHLYSLADRLGISPSIAYIEGDDLLPRLEELQSRGEELANIDSGQTLGAAGIEPITANAYLGGWGIATALESGADVVICPRVADASLVVGPAAWWFGWSRDDWDRLAGAVVAGHVLECGPQATGGNYSFFEEVPGLEHPAFPIAELFADGHSIITKHEDTGGAVTIGTVTAQLLYEIGPPGYPNPDVVARFDSIELDQVGPNRVEIRGVRGEPAPKRLKLSINYHGGFRNESTFVIVGPDVDAKAALVERTVRERLSGATAPAHLEFRFARTGRADANTTEEASSLLHVVVKDLDPRKVGRSFSNQLVELALASYPGLHLLTPPTPEQEYAVHWPALVSRSAVRERVLFPDRSLDISSLDQTADSFTDAQPPKVRCSPLEPHVAETQPQTTTRAPLGLLFGARSGDKGGNANVGVWSRTEASYGWLSAYLTTERLRELLPETRSLHIDRYELPGLLALNFVIHGLLGDGVASSTRFDPQAKSLGELLRSQVVSLPDDLVSPYS